MFLRLLFDECLSPALTTVAHPRGIEATPVIDLGLATHPDYLIIAAIIGNDWTSVTNNRADFVWLYRNIDVYAGLLVILSSVPLAEQRRLLGAALDAIEAAGGDATNQLVEVDADSKVVMSQWPFSGTNP